MMCIRCYFQGAKLVLSSRTEASLREVKSECLVTYSGEDKDILVLPLDVTEFESHKTAADKVLQHFKKVAR